MWSCLAVAARFRLLPPLDLFARVPKYCITRRCVYYSSAVLFPNDHREPRADVALMTSLPLCVQLRHDVTQRSASRSPHVKRTGLLLITRLLLMGHHSFLWLYIRISKVFRIDTDSDLYVYICLRYLFINCKSILLLLLLFCIVLLFCITK